MSRPTKYKTFSKLSSTISSTIKQPATMPNVQTCVEVVDKDQRASIIHQNKIVCIYLFATWCGPCKVVGPKFAELAQEFNKEGSVMLVKENIENNLTCDYKIKGIPAFIFYINGTLHTEQVVGGDIEAVRGILEKHI